MECSDFFSTHEVIGSSLLFVHDRSNASVWLIDFAKTVMLPNEIKISHDNIWSVGNHEDGYLIGINNLIDIFEEILSSQDTNEVPHVDIQSVSDQEVSDHGANQETNEVSGVPSQGPNQLSSKESDQQTLPKQTASPLPNQTSSSLSDQAPSPLSCDGSNQKPNEESTPKSSQESHAVQNVIVASDVLSTVPNHIITDEQLNNNSEKMSNLSIQS